MKLNRIFAYLVGCATLLLSLLAYAEYIYSLGFPDGFITELGFAERKIAYAFIGVSVVLGFYFIYLGVGAARQKMGKKLLAAFFLYLLFIAGIFLIDYYQAHLMGNSGG